MMPDARTWRGRESQRGIADALVALLSEGTPTPTAQAIALRAGVSLRLVFHHFRTLEDVYRLAVAVVTVEHFDGLEPVTVKGTLPDRVERTVRQWSRAYESVGPFWRAAHATAHVMPSLPDALAMSDAVLAGHLQVTFGPELRCAAREVSDAAQVILSFEAWDRLRRLQGVSAAVARRAVGHALHALLAAPPSRGLPHR